MKKVFVIDNYDSFTYNLVHILRDLGLGEGIRVALNDRFALEDIEPFDCVLLSPGPGLPRHAGLMPRVVERYAATKNILGVCLGHQAIGEAFGGKLVQLNEVFHGMVTPVKLTAQDPMFEGIPFSFAACRYHSWAIDRNMLPDELEVLAVDGQEVIMAVRHRDYRVRGVQFHPESVMSEHGKQMINNWVGL